MIRKTGKTFQEKMKTARKEVNMSQTELAKILGLSKLAISAYENREVNVPIPTLKKIALITRKNIAWFFDDNDETRLNVASRIRRIEEEIERIKIELQHDCDY